LTYRFDVLVGVVGLQVQELGHDQVGDLGVDDAAQEHDAVVEEAGVDVERALAARATARRPWGRGA